MGDDKLKRALEDVLSKLNSHDRGLERVLDAGSEREAEESWELVVKGFEERCRREGGRFRRRDGWVACEFDKFYTAKIYRPEQRGDKWVVKTELEFK